MGNFLFSSSTSRGQDHILGFTDTGDIKQLNWITHIIFGEEPTFGDAIVTIMVVLVLYLAAMAIQATLLQREFERMTPDEREAFRRNWQKGHWVGPP